MVNLRNLFIVSLRVEKKHSASIQLYANQLNLH